MGVLSSHHVSEPVPRISQQPHGVLATLIRLPWLWAILLLASAVRFMVPPRLPSGATKAPACC